MDLLFEQLVLDLLEVKKINRMMLDYYLYLISNYIFNSTNGYGILINGLVND